MIPKPHGWPASPEISRGDGFYRSDQRLTPEQALEKVRSLELKTPAESAAFVRQDRDGRSGQS